MPLDRLTNKLTKEVLWIYILRILKDKDCYAYELKKEIKKRFKFLPATVSSYVVLYSLEMKGYVKANWKIQTTKSPRKYYSITKNGEELLKNGILELNKIIDHLQ